MGSRGPAVEVEGEPRRPDLRMPLLGAAAWVGALAAHVLSGRVLLAVVGGAVVGLAVARLRCRRAVVRTAAGLVAAAAAVAVAATVREAAVVESPVAALAEQRAGVSLSGTVVSDPAPVPGRYGEQVLVRLDARQVTGRGLVHRLSVPVLVLGAEDWADVRLGATVRTTGRLAPADGDDLAAILTSPAPPDEVEPPDVWWRGAAAVRAAVRDAVAHRPAEQAALVPALVDGDDAALSPQLEEDFRTTGLTHLTAVSGTNLTLVVGFVLVVARWCRVRGRWLHLAGAAGIVGFVLLARTEPSVVRAAVMGVVGLVALAAGGRRLAVRALGVAVVGLLLVQPGLAVAPGFALSVLATAGIVLLAPGWRDALATWLPRWLAEAVAVPAAAQLACTPLVAALSGQVSLVAVLANLLVAPAVGPATVLGLAAGLVTLVVPALGSLLGSAAGWCVAWIVLVARRGADLPVAAVEWGTGAVALGVLTGLCLALALLAPRVLRHRGAALTGCVLVVVATTVRLPTPGWPPDGWLLAMCDVGQGDALVLHAARGDAVVVDAGPDPAAVDGCLDRLGVTRVPLVVLSHFHADHVAGLEGVLEGREVGAVEGTRVLDPLPGAQATLATAAEHRLAVHQARPEVVRSVGAVRLQVLWPEPGPVVHGGEEGGLANDASVVLLAEAGGLRVLLTGDVEPPSQARLARLLGGLDVDVLKVPHHGSRHQDLGWLTSLDPEVALVSVGADNDYGHPADDVLDALAAAGADVRRTDTDGDVVVAVDGGEAVVRTRGGA